MAEFRDLFREVINDRHRAFLVRCAPLGRLAPEPLRMAARRPAPLRAFPARQANARGFRRGGGLPPRLPRLWHAVIYRGKITGYYQSYSDALATFMLKGSSPRPTATTRRSRRRPVAPRNQDPAPGGTTLTLPPRSKRVSSRDRCRLRATAN